MDICYCACHDFSSARREVHVAFQSFYENKRSEIRSQATDDTFPSGSLLSSLLEKCSLPLEFDGSDRAYESESNQQRASPPVSVAGAEHRSPLRFPSEKCFNNGPPAR